MALDLVRPRDGLRLAQLMHSVSAPTDALVEVSEVAEALDGEGVIVRRAELGYSVLQQPLGLAMLTTKSIGATEV